MEKVTDKVERIKVKSKVFLNENIKAFIEDINGDYYFCEVLTVEENYLVVKGFAGKRNLEVDRIFYVDIIRFEEYQEESK